MAMNRRRKAPRGVVLLIVISLLVLFVLIAVTFAVVAGQYRQAAQIQVNVEATGDPPRKDLDMVMYMTLRDTVPGTALFDHSLLNDKYGNDYADGTLVDLQPMNANYDVIAEAGGQFVHLQFNPNPQRIPVLQSGYYNGCVLSFVAGSATGYSTRIVSYTPPTYNAMGNLQSLGELRYESADADGNAIPYPRAGDRFLINGHEFNGTGPGADPSTGNIDSLVQIVPNVSSLGPNPLLTALLPHYGAYLTTPNTSLPIGMPQPTSANVGGTDESFDAATFHDMWLAYLPSLADPDEMILPSYHRPDLILYWYTIVASTLMTGLQPAQQLFVFEYPYGLDGIANTADDSGVPWTTVNTNGNGLGINAPYTACQFIARLKRYITLRPLVQDHPNFTGSNASFTLVGTQNAATMVWDIDNDGDGVADSIWLDVGLPVATSPDGRRYKKLFAIMIRDMDGRININAAGALAHMNAVYTNPVSGALAGSPGPVPLSRGLGVGPADLNYSSIFTLGGYGNVLTGRHGGDGLPGTPFDDTLSWLKSVGIPNNYSASPSSYGSPPDLAGQGAIAVDHFGQPLTGYMGQNGETTNDPYELDPVRGSAADSRYTLGEFERILRYHDQDVDGLPQRLLQIAPSDFSILRTRRAVTTHSSHVPIPNVQLPPEVRTALANGTPGWWTSLLNASSPTILDVYRARLLAGGVPPNLINQEMQKMVPFEILHGQPFDINRWFGNGLDDNGNGVVDEYNEELPPGEVIWNGAPPATFTGIGFNYGNDTPGVIDPRQLYARQLYCLMRLLIDEQYPWQTTDPALNSIPLQQQFVYRRLAQWAINVVDFRDRDAIMTPFECDINPFNGWICDGNPGTDEGPERFVVWGTEYPDLLITETLAMHDRRVKDTNYDSLQQFRWDAAAMRIRAMDVDQYRKPEGSTFLELYCTRNFASNNAAFPLELYDANGNLDLGRLAPSRTFGMAGQQVRHPVWRAVICPPPLPAIGPLGIESVSSIYPDTATYEPAAMSGGVPSVERIVWFTPHDPANVTTNDANRIFYCRSGSLSANPNTVPAGQQVGSNVVLPPNRHLVVGPRPVTAMGSMINGLDGNPDTLDISPHQFLINGGLFAIAGGVYSTPVFGYPIALPAMGAVIPAPLGIVCAAKPPAGPSGWMNQNALIGLNVSEPMPQANYYAEPTHPNDQYADLNLPFDPMTNFVPSTPFDGVPAAGRILRDENKIKTGSYANHRTVYLQRLANPLLPWNPEPSDPDFGGYFSAAMLVNPYLTVDWSTIDLTVFSGNQDNDSQVTDSVSGAMGWIDPSDPDPYASDPPEQFAGRERGQPTMMGSVDNLWSPYTTPPSVTAGSTGDPDHYFDRLLNTSLGYLNKRYGVPLAPVAGYEGSPFSQTGAPNPFPWLTWNNRPFANPMELMLVPASSPSRIGLEFSKWDLGTWNPYADQRQAFGHLLNFFQTSPPGSPPGSAPHLYRLFDYVETPSMFVGTERWYNPSTFATDPNAPTFRPPYNRLSRFREPGRVNANTVADEWEWQAVIGVTPLTGMPPFPPGFPGFGNYVNAAGLTSWQTIRRSRDGRFFNGITNYPTQFANPFRTAASADLMPNVAGMRRSGAEATLLRSLPPALAATVPVPVVLTPPTWTASREAEFRLVSPGQQFQDTDKNAYFRYRGVNRLSNLLSTHSNVFAVWITVGYFEVEDNPSGPDEGHLDGLRLGQEIGFDSGTTARHRAFYIIDRSVPVAYERGQNHNVDRAVLLRRFIE